MREIWESLNSISDYSLKESIEYTQQELLDALKKKFIVQSNPGIGSGLILPSGEFLIL